MQNEAKRVQPRPPMANPTTPRILPPGVVPSASREDVAALLEQEQCREQSIVREASELRGMTLRMGEEM